LLYESPAMVTLFTFKISFSFHFSYSPSLFLFLILSLSFHSLVRALSLRLSRSLCVTVILIVHGQTQLSFSRSLIRSLSRACVSHYCQFKRRYLNFISVLSQTSICSYKLGMIFLSLILFGFHFNFHCVFIWFLIGVYRSESLSHLIPWISVFLSR